jgi:two-component system, NtrC family, sensor kinase
LRIGTKLTLYLSLIIILVLSGYGYLDVLSRRDILIRKMKAEVRSTGQTLTVSLEKISPGMERRYIQGLIDAVGQYERTMKVVVYFQEGDLLFRSLSLNEKIEPYLALIKRSIRENQPQEEFETHNRIREFSYAFPLRDETGKGIGGVAILQPASVLEKEVVKAKENILLTILILIAGTVVLVLWGTRKWVSQPIAKMMEGIRSLAKGNLDQKVDLKMGGELAELAGAFNQMASDLKKAQERIVREAETKLELERSLRQSEKLATLGQLASGLAHEVGTPLNIIYGRAEFIQRKPGDKEEIQKNVNIILGQTERITRIIQQLLGMVRKKKHEYVALNIHALLDGTLDLLDHQIQKQRIRLEKGWGSDPLAVKGDPDQLQQVFLNLVLNALQAMPGGGTLRLATSTKSISQPGLAENQRQSRQYLEIRFEDTGGGMENEVRKNLFTPFFTTKATGSGLGLMVSQGIVRDHEGWIEVESEVGKGAVFKVYLPFGPGEEKDGGIKP